MKIQVMTCAWIGALSLGILAACGSSRPGEPEARTPADPVELAEVEGSVELHDVDASARRVILTADSLQFAPAGGEPVDLVTLVGGRIPSEHRQGNERSYLVTPLFERLETPQGADTTLWVSASTRSRTVAEVMYTLGRQHVRVNRFVVRRGDDRGTLNIELPTFPAPVRSVSDRRSLHEFRAILGDEVTQDEQRREAPAVVADPSPTEGPSTPTAIELRASDEPLVLAISLVDNGITVAAGAGWLSPDCRTVERERHVTIPAREGARDFAGLHQCLSQVRSIDPDPGPTVVSAAPDVPFSEIARAIATTQPIFSPVSFGGVSGL